MLCLLETHLVVMIRQQGFAHASAVNVGIVAVWYCCSMPAVHHAKSLAEQKWCSVPSVLCFV